MSRVDAIDLADALLDLDNPILALSQIRSEDRLLVDDSVALRFAGTLWWYAHQQTIRGKVLKIGAQVRVTSRKVWLSFSESYPYAALLRRVLARLQAFPLRC